MAEPKENLQMEKIVSLCKRRGFIFQSSEIYGGINGFWDYGPLGAELKRNVKELWWQAMTRQREDVAGLEATIIMSPEIWKASGHVDTFSDPMCDCLLTKKRFRADQVEPQSGVVYQLLGARRTEDGSKKSSFPKITLVLLPAEEKPPGKRPENTAASFLRPKRFGATRKAYVLHEETNREGGTKTRPVSIRKTARCSPNRARST